MWERFMSELCEEHIGPSDGGGSDPGEVSVTATLQAASEVLRLLSERREDLVAERTRALNRLHGLLRDLVPGGVSGKLSADRAARILRAIRPKGASARLRRQLASEVLRDVRTLNRKIADLNERIGAEVEASGTTLTEIFGVGPILDARIIGTIGSVARFPSKGHFASYSGTAPVETSSGEVVRHRLSLAGNRKPAPCRVTS